jgi:hypothetical protein
MTEPDRQTDIEKLLAEVDGSLSGRPATPARHAEPATPATRALGGLRTRARGSVVAGAAAAVTVGGLFVLLPFLGAISGAAGAFLGAFAVALVLRRR